ncbi:hypothetical protein KCP78_13520 [Salmonella enterica subsp. enterica]|nr:hypothetical protein KCP78_13520 [Salmonella enterica subsp. enterica]
MNTGSRVNMLPGSSGVFEPIKETHMIGPVAGDTACWKKRYRDCGGPDLNVPIGGETGTAKSWWRSYSPWVPERSIRWSISTAPRCRTRRRASCLSCAGFYQLSVIVAVVSNGG